MNCLFKLRVLKIAQHIMIISLLILPFFNIANSQEDLSWWNDEWSFRQAIDMPIDTSLEYAKYQPIDLLIKFENPCWTKNEFEHSIRVIFQDNDNFKELESQIYDLEPLDDEHIKSCGLVFLIPSEANGQEKYFVYYDDAEKNTPIYDDHIKIEEDYYYYAPISMVPFESYNYKITQDGFVAYGAALQGQFIGYSTAQQITILKPGTLDVTGPKDGAAWASFDYFYNYGSEAGDFSSTIEKLISKEIFIDGNLMVEFGIVSQSGKDDFRTTATYKCYYSPTSDRRIYVHVIHEALKESTVIDVPPNREAGGNVASLQVMRMRSPSIKDLNFGRMFPYMHVFSEDDMILEYDLDMDPEYPPESITILDCESDVELGKKAWASFDDGVTGEAHAIIFDSNTMIKSGTNEKDGIQIQAFEAASPGVLGLETDGSSYYYSRNFYEKDGKWDFEIPNDFVVEYNAEFYTTPTKGYIGVDKEAEIFQILVKNRPSNIKEAEEVEVEKGDCSLTAFIHLTSSMPMGSTLAALTGRKFSYISAELYQNDTLTSTSFAERLSLDNIPSFSDTKPFEKIKLFFNFLDLRNFTFFKKVCFQNLKPGNYVLKIFKENKLIGKDRKFIGYKILEVDGDSKTHIFCRPEGSIKISVFDQNKNGVENVEAQLLFNDVVISKCITDVNGTGVLKSPCSLKDKYTLRLKYKGFVLHEENVKQRYIRAIIPIKELLDIELYDFNIKFLDTLGLNPPYKLNPVLTIEQMDEKITIIGQNIEDNYYLFENIYPADYLLEVKYKSFILEENIHIPLGKDEIEFIFPAQYDIKLNIFDTRGISIEDTSIKIQRENKKIEFKNYNDEVITLPVGIYNVKVFYDNELVGQRNINVMSDGDFDFVTIKVSQFPFIILILSIVISLIGAIYCFKNKDILLFLKILVISISIISIVSPWWILQGNSSDPLVDTTTSIFIMPASIVTKTITSNVIAGEVASSSLPPILTMALTALSIFIVIGCVLVFLNMIFKKFGKERLSVISLSISFLLMLGSLTIFTIGISLLTKLGVGSFFGSGNIEVNIIGEELRESVYCNWGPNLGFILCLASIIILIMIFLLNIRKMMSIKTKKGRFLTKDNLIKISKKLMPLIGVVLLIYLIVDIGTGEIVSTFGKISPIYIIIAAVLTLPRILLRNIQWQYILKKQKIFISFLKSFKIFLIGYFYAAVTPGYMGGLIRVPYLKDETDAPTGKLFINCFVFSAGNAFLLYFMAVIGAFLISEYIPEALPIAIIVLIAHIIVYFYFIKKERGHKTFHLLVKFFIPKPLKSIFMRFIDTFYDDFPDIRDFIVPVLISIPCWMIMYGQIYILGLSFDIKIPYFTFIMLYAIANIISFIPITSAGLGTREATLIFLFSYYGVDPAIAVVISLSGHLLTDVLTGFYGFIISIFEARDTKKSISLSELEDTLKNGFEDTKK